jgi:hypothetical protein
MGLQETMDESGTVLRKSSDSVPELLSGPDFIRVVWDTHEYRFETLSTFLAKTADLKTCGGFPGFWKGTSSDDALVMTLCLNSFVTLSTRCAYRKRFYDNSYGYAMTAAELARGIKEFLKFLDQEPVFVRFAEHNSAGWAEIKRVMVNNAWKTYYYRWMNIYRQRLPTYQWMRAGFDLPFIPDYYRAVSRACLGVSKSKLWRAIR